MGPDDLTALITEVGREPLPPSGVDVDRARRDGRRIRRTRRLQRVGAAAASIAVVVSAASLLSRITAAPTESGSAGGVRAPVRFDPMVRYADFGWLPSNLTQRTWRTGIDHLTLEAGVADPRRPLTEDDQVSVRLFPVGRKVPDYARDTERISPVCAPGERTDRAPAVHGRSAWWVRSPVAGGRCIDVQLRWEYAPGAWAVAETADPTSVKGDRWNVLYRIAQTLRLGVDEPVQIPFRAGYVPPGLRVTGTSETRERPDHWSVTLVLGPRTRTAGPATPATTDPPGTAIGVRPASPHPDQTPNTTVDGRPAYGAVRYLSVFDVHGLRVDIVTSANTKDEPARILRGLRLLGPDRAAWTTRPLT